MNDDTNAAAEAARLASEIPMAPDTASPAGPPVSATVPVGPPPVPTAPRPSYLPPHVRTSEGGRNGDGEQAPSAVEDRRPAKPPKMRATRRFFGGDLDRLLPDTRQVKLWKRDEYGHLHYLRAYPIEDLGRTASIEEFVRAYLMPKAGEGIYEYALVTDTGESKRGEVSVMDVDHGDAGPARGESKELAGVLHRMMDRMDSLEEKLRAPREPEHRKSVVEEMAEYSAAMAEMKKLAGAGQQGGGGSMMETMMMMRFMDRDRDREPRRDDSTQRELAALRTEIRMLAEEPRGPMPLPVPQSDPLEVVERIMDKIADRMRPMASADPLDTLQKAKAILAPDRPQSDPELRAELGALRDKIGAATAPTRGFRDFLEDFKTFEQLTGIRPGGHGESSEGATFEDFINNLISPDTIDAVTRLVHEVRTEESKGGGSGSTSGGGSGSTSGERRRPKLPAGFSKYTALVEKAENDADRLNAVLRAVQFLSKQSDWKPFIKRVVDAGKADDKSGILEFARSFLDGLRDGGQISGRAARECYETVERHIDRVVEIFGGAKDKDAGKASE